MKTQHHRLTYAALNQFANRVAHAILTRCGVGAEPIALLLNHDAPLIAAILGVLKAGKIYVPLDAAFPRARLTYMLEDSQARLVVTNTKMLSLASELAGEASHVLDIEAIAASVSSDNPAHSLHQMPLPISCIPRVRPGNPRASSRTIAMCCTLR